MIVSSGPLTGVVVRETGFRRRLPHVRQTAGTGEARETGDIVADTPFEAHPLLDPELTAHQPALLRYLYRIYLEIRNDPERYNAFLNSVFQPRGVERPLQANLTTAAYYLNEATGYIGELLLMIPSEMRRLVTPRPEVMGCPDLQELFALVFGSKDRRVSFEAQRKLYLAKLFFDVDHNWEVQRGSEHKEFFERIIDRTLFAHTAARRRCDICYNIRPDGETMEYTLGPARHGQECWSFDLREVALPSNRHVSRVRIYFYTCRFKREVIPHQYKPGDVYHHAGPTEFLEGLTKRRSASIVSKMLRKGENDPRWIQDLIGAMFIVHDLREVEAMRDALFDVFGGIFRVRNVVNTLENPDDRDKLGSFSSSGYDVFKAEVDVLYNPERPRLPMPYAFTSEIQIYTLESYLRTIHSEHYASHQAFKRRQFLQGLVPHLFPGSVYGKEIVSALKASGSGNRKEGGSPVVSETADTGDQK